MIVSAGVWLAVAWSGRAVSAPGGAPSAVAAASSSSPLPNTPEAEEVARQAIKRGLAAFARGEARAALAEYQLAQQLVPKANLPYRYAGEAQASLGNIEQAIASYEAYLAVKPDVGDADLVRARIEQLRGKLVGSVSISSLPSGADVFLDEDEASRGKTPLRLERVQRGTHRVTVRLGERRASGQVEVEGGAGASVALELSAAPEATPSASAPAPPAPGGKSTWRAVGIGIGALGAAALVTGVVVDLGILPGRIDEYDAAARRRDGTAGGLRSGIERLQTAGLVSYLGGAALLGTGVVLVLVGKPGRGTQASVGLSGVSLHGSF